MAGENEVQDLALARGQAGHALRSGLPPRGGFVGVAHLIECTFDAGEQVLVADRLLNEIHSSRLHRLDGHRHGAVAGDYDGRQLVAVGLEALDQIDAAHAWHQRIDQHTSFLASTIGREERLPIGEGLHRIPVRAQQIAHRLPDRAVVVDHEHGCSSLAFRKQGRLHRWLGEEALDVARQLPGSDRLVQMYAAVGGDLAQGNSRDVAGQNHGRDVLPDLLPQAGDDLGPVESVRQIVVGDDEVRNGPLCRQLQSPAPIGGDQGAMTLVVEKLLQQLAHRRVVLDDQNGAYGRGALVRIFLCQLRDVRRAGPPQRHLDGEDRAHAHARADVDVVAEQVGEAQHNGESQAEALASLARGIVELMELPEDRLKLQLGNTWAGVPDLDAELVAAAPAAKQDLALAGVFHRVRQQVADDLSEQAGIAAHRQTARDHAPVEI